MNKTVCVSSLCSEPVIVRVRERWYTDGSLGSCSREPADGQHRYDAIEWLQCMQSIGWYHDGNVFVPLGRRRYFFKEDKPWITENTAFTRNRISYAWQFAETGTRYAQVLGR